MDARRERILIAGAVIACLTWAGVEARHVSLGPPRMDPCASRLVDPSAVEASYRELVRLLDRGMYDEAVLTLRERTVRGPFPGYAWFLLGEVAFAAEQPRQGVLHYRKAVETDPTVADRHGPLGAARRIQQRTDALRDGLWKTNPPEEIRALYFLQRRLAGGCE